jgi:hypothetical protein
MNSWNAEPSRLRDTQHAVQELARLSGAGRGIVIIDGSDKLLPALGLVGQAGRLGGEAPFVLLIAEEAQIATLAEVDGGELDGFIPTPLSDELLANALDGLPLEAQPLATELHAVPQPSAPRQPPAAGVPSAHEAERITAIAAHPKFVPEPATAVDPRAIERLHALGGGPVFVCDVVEAFLADARRIITGIEEAVAAADPERFARGLLELHRAAGHVGGSQLCEVAASLGGLTSPELRVQGATHLQRLVSEIDRLAVALVEVASPTAFRLT